MSLEKRGDEYLKKNFSVKVDSSKKPNPNFIPPPTYKCECYHTRTKTTYLDPTTVARITGEWPKNNGAIETEVGECWGTKGFEECKCGGDKNKCDFYDDVRNGNAVESESSSDNTNYEIVSDPITFDTMEDILTSKYIDPPMRKLIYWFNKCGFKTMWCCYGHRIYEKCYIWFAPNLKDDNFENLAKTAFNSYGLNFGKLNKTFRISTDDNAKIGLRWEWGVEHQGKEFKDICIKFMTLSLQKYYESL